MDVHQAIKNRRSVRSYKSDLVPEDKLARVLEAARMAPSAHNDQDYKFIVVKNPETRKQLADASRSQEFITQAPVVIVAVSLNPEAIMSSGVPTYAVDVAIAIDHIMLQAWEEGLGTCWIGAFSQDRVKEILSIPDKYKVVALFPLGYPADSPETKTRKELKEIVCQETFNE